MGMYQSQISPVHPMALAIFSAHSRVDNSSESLTLNTRPTFSIPTFLSQPTRCDHLESKKETLSVENSACQNPEIVFAWFCVILVGDTPIWAKSHRTKSTLERPCEKVFVDLR